LESGSAARSFFVVEPTRRTALVVVGEPSAVAKISKDFIVDGVENLSNSTEAHADI
jgi:hypothetical protein